MTPQNLLAINTALIRQELAHVGARASRRRYRLVDTPGWVHDTCNAEAIIEVTHATHVEHLCGRCGYRALHAHDDGRLIEHHGGNGPILLRRPDYASDVVLTDFADREAFRYTYEQLTQSTDNGYSLLVVNAPKSQNAFELTVVHGQLSDLDDTPLRSYLLTCRQVMEQRWAGWRQIASAQLSEPLPPQLGRFSFSDRRGNEEGTLHDGRLYSLSVLWDHDPHNPWVSVALSGFANHWTSPQNQR